MLKDAHWRVNDVVLVRPPTHSLYFGDFLALLRRGGGWADAPGAAPGRVYLHQVEMNVHLPALLNLTGPISDRWLPANALLKEVNLWMSGGGTTTSLHQDATENIVAQVAGAKEWVLFRPNQKGRLYYSQVTEIGGEARRRRAPPSRVGSRPTGVVDVTARSGRPYANAGGLRCRLEEDARWRVPSLWHAVHSEAGDGRNVAVNFFLTSTVSREAADACTRRCSFRFREF